MSVSRFALLAVFGAVLVTPTLAQQQEPQPGSQERQRKEEMTYTGCLAKGDSQGEYKFTEASGSAKTVVASSGVDLDKHSANHTVKLTGTMGTDGKLTATKVEHVSDTCQSAK
jgi:hypothetical protein